MITTLPIGTPIVMREGGGYKLWQVADKGYTGLHVPGTHKGRRLGPGDTIHFVVWKGDRIESRKQYTLRAGDVSWVNSGMLKLSKTTQTDTAALAKNLSRFMDDIMHGKPATLPSFPVQPIYPQTEKYYYFVNRFGGTCPAWLRDVR